VKELEDMALWSMVSLQDTDVLSSLDRVMRLNRNNRWWFLAHPEWGLRTPFNFTCSICGFFLLFWCTGSCDTPTSPSSLANS